MSRFGGKLAEPEGGTGGRFGGRLVSDEPEIAEYIDPQMELANEYSAPEKALIGVGRSVAQTGQGVKQLGLKAGEAMGFISDQEVEDYRKQIADEKALYERGVGGTTAGKVGEVGGAIAQAIPTMFIPGGAAAQLSTRVGTSAGVGAAESALQPVYSEEGFAGEKVKQAATGALIGGAATYGLDKLAGFMPKNLMSRFYTSAQTRGADSVAEADILEDMTGIKMTPAEKAESRGVQILENIARQSIHTADEISDYDKKVATQGVEAVNKLLMSITTPGKGAETVGNELQKAAKDATDAAINSRRTMADHDYGIANDLAGGEKVVNRDNYIDELKKIVDEYQGSDAQDAMAIVKQTKDKLARAVTPETRTPGSIVDTQGNPLTLDVVPEAAVKQTVKNAVGDRSFYGNASKGTGNVFKDIDKNLNKVIAGRLHKAITKDLIGAEYLGDVGTALKKANDNYIDNSKTIDAIQASPLGKILGREYEDVMGAIDAGTFNSLSGENALKKIVKLSNSEKQMVMNSLDKLNPNAANSLRGFVIEDAMAASKYPASSPRAGELSFDKFISNINKADLGAYGFTSADSKQIKRIVDGF